jgi:predicted DNA-binding protein (MmcQ/YjbR family)
MKQPLATLSHEVIGSKFMTTTSTQSMQSWSAFALDDSHRLAQHTRPSTVPAYYMGRPAWFWLALFRRTKSHA